MRSSARELHEIHRTAMRRALAAKDVEHDKVHNEQREQRPTDRRRRGAAWAQFRGVPHFQLFLLLTHHLLPV